MDRWAFATVYKSEYRNRQFQMPSDRSAIASWLCFNRFYSTGRNVIRLFYFARVVSSVEGREKENEIWNKKMLWECEIGGRGVRSRTTAGASSSDSWTNQMGRPKPGADIEIGNQRRTPAIRRRQTEAEEQKMQHNKGRTKGLREGRSESIRMETGRRGKRYIFEPEHISNLLSGLCTSSGVACYFQSEKEDWAMQRRKKLSPLLWEPAAAYVEKEGAGKEEQPFYFGTWGGGFG